MPGLIPPNQGTLKRYGLTIEDWWRMVRRQRGVCPVCKQPFGERRLVIDHEHVTGWNAHKRRRGKRGKVKVRVMTPLQRREHVRGILHAWCNGYVRAWLTLSRARAIVEYLEAHEKRKREVK